MRIVIADPMRSGAGPLACILASVYGLRRLTPAESPGRGDVTGFAAWAESGGFPDGTILQQHFPFSQAFADALGATPTRTVAVIRDPYDAFVSLYNLIQAQADRPRKAEAIRSRRADIMVGKPIDHPDVVAFLGHDFRESLVRADEWRRAGQAIVLRYEELIDDPVAAVGRLAEEIGLADPGAIERAIRSCRSEELRRGQRGNAKRSAEVGAANGVLGDVHFAAVASRFGDLVADLGYAVRQPSTGPVAPLRPAAEEPEEEGDELIPPLERLRFGYARKGGRKNFVRVGEGMVQRLVQHAGLTPTDRVLDVGSGVGRMAIGLTRFLSPEGCYEGFDVDVQGITWCQENVTPRYPNFRFQVADVYNQHYHPEGSQPASEYRFPYDDASFDLVFLTSVFTHLVPADLENYLRQIHRVLAPGGRSFITMFLLNDAAQKDIDENASVRKFRHDRGVYRVEHAEHPERAVAYDEAYVRRLWAETGLEIKEPILYGGWPRRKLSGEGQQDAVVAVKRA